MNVVLSLQKLAPPNAENELSTSCISLGCPTSGLTDLGGSCCLGSDA